MFARKWNMEGLQGIYLQQQQPQQQQQPTILFCQIKLR